MNIWFLIALGIWIFTGLLRIFYERPKFMNPGKRKNEKPPASLVFSMFFFWTAWFFMAFSDPVNLARSAWPRYVGAGVYAAGLLVFILAEITRGGVTDTGMVVTKGLYSKIRHPMYLGQVLMAVGVPLFARGLVTLCLSILWIVQVLFWKTAEERALLARYPEYERYMESTWF